MKIIQITADMPGRLFGLGDDGSLYQFNLSTRTWDRIDK